MRIKKHARKAEWINNMETELQKKKKKSEYEHR